MRPLRTLSLRCDPHRALGGESMPHPKRAATPFAPKATTACKTKAAPPLRIARPGRKQRNPRYALAAFFSFVSFFSSKNCSSSVEWLNAVVDDWLPCTVVVTASK